MATRTSRPIDEAISSDYIKQERFKELFSDQLFHKATREYIEKIIEEYAGKVLFMEIVRKYAGMEIDSRLYRSFGYWIGIIATAVLTSTIGYLLGKYIFS